MKVNIPQGLCIIEFGGGCAGCYNAMSDARESAKELNIPFIYVDVEMNYEMVIEYNVVKLPTIALLKDGKIFSSATGYQPKEILDIWLENKIQEAIK